VTDESRERLAGPRCPTCARPVSRPENPSRPFCALTRKLSDLGGWRDGTHRVPGAPLSLPATPFADVQPGTGG
jgi:endogenous inhibitor of DNA gyrase (YacG/DUF329 family)